MIDTHCHVYDEAFVSDLDDVMERAASVGVSCLLLPNINTHTVPDMLNVCDAYPDICHPMVGLHPEDLEVDYHAQLDYLKSLLDKDRKPGGEHRFVGIGETGIDLYWDTTRLDDQIDSFRTQIEWALECDLPIVIHCRKAFAQLYEVLSHYKNSGLRGVFHCFSGGANEARALMEYSGFMFGIGGVITYKKIKEPHAFQVLPMERIVLETDAPYLPPVPYRGKRNEPSYMVHTAQFLAQLYGISIEEVVSITSQNATRLFRL